MPSSWGRDRSGCMEVWLARFIPALLTVAIGWSIYTVTYSISVQYLFRPPTFAPYRVSTGTAIIVLQHLLLLPVIISWSRFFYALVVNSGALPLGEKIEVPAGPVENSDIQKPQDSLNLSKRPVTANGSGVPKGQSANEVSKTTEEQRANEASETTGEQRVESLDTSNTVVAPNMGLDRQAMLKGMLTPPPGLEEFHTKDFFICGYDGLPNYCNTCRTWKPDRVHHCSELNRCFRLYDHFCPWVGGPITEMTYKFFIQFTFYAFFYCVYIFVVMIWALRAKLHDCQISEFCFGNSLQPDWLAAIIIAALIGFMAIGLFCQSTLGALRNRTCVEDLQLQAPSYCIAVRIKESEVPPPRLSPPPFHWVSYPLSTPSEFASSRQQRDWFAVLPPKPGMNPWNLGWLQNWKSIMGERPIDWFLPVLNSPCSRRDDPTTDYPLGHEFRSFVAASLPGKTD